MHFVAHHGYPPEGLELARRTFPRPADTDSVPGRAILNRAVVHIPDMNADPDVPPVAVAFARTLGFRSLLAVPMLREGQPIGAILVTGGEAPFTQKQIDLVRTFADQAVIAIENVRLFQELQEKNHALTTALDQQTATGEILRVISSSPTDVSPLFDAIAGNARRLLGGYSVAVWRVNDDALNLVAFSSTSDEGDAVLRATMDRRPLERTALADQRTTPAAARKDATYADLRAARRTRKEFSRLLRFAENPLY